VYVIIERTNFRISKIQLTGEETLILFSNPSSHSPTSHSREEAHSPSHQSQKKTQCSHMRPPLTCSHTRPLTHSSTYSSTSHSEALPPNANTQCTLAPSHYLHAYLSRALLSTLSFMRPLAYYHSHALSQGAFQKRFSNPISSHSPTIHSREEAHSPSHQSQKKTHSHTLPLTRFLSRTRTHSSTSHSEAPSHTHPRSQSLHNAPPCMWRAAYCGMWHASHVTCGTMWRRRCGVLCTWHVHVACACGVP
jgi:hypothetical protein